MTTGEGAGCLRCREVVSADLDGEAGLEEREWSAAHLAGCAACRSWEHRAAGVTRRMRTASEPGPDLVARALVHAPRPRPRLLRPAVLARAGLGVIGLVQVLLGAVALLGAATHLGGDHAMAAGDGVSLLGAGMAHVAHETAAWNLALGAAFLVGASWPRHLAGLLPALGVFIVLLAVLSGIDLAGGRVDAARVVSHLLLVAGFVLGVAVVRAGPYPRRGPSPGGRAGAGEPEAAPARDAGRPSRRLDESAPDVA